MPALRSASRAVRRRARTTRRSASMTTRMLPARRPASGASVRRDAGRVTTLVPTPIRHPAESLCHWRDDGPQSHIQGREGTIDVGRQLDRAPADLEHLRTMLETYMDKKG